ncbi:patatin-like phospholipase family protein [Ruegeria atlantica]|uniref:patatin-like phospholipase family protein n=1 Tax=Ruegeria atlantica TaxID=81569 RepID=UPI00249511D6|nr:patatin-like phospholipase family protein [Ruegeria atlantica]
MYQLFRILYGPTFLAFGFWYFCTLDPVKEVFLGYAADMGKNGVGFSNFSKLELSWNKPVVSFWIKTGLLCFIPISLWSASRIALHEFGMGDERKGKKVSIVLGGIAYFGLITGVTQAAFSPDATGLPKWPFLVLVLVFVPLFSWVYIKLHRLLVYLIKLDFGHLIVAVPAASILYAIDQSPALRETIGASGVTSIFFVLAAYGLVTLTVLSRRMPGGFEIIFLLLMLSQALMSPFRAIVFAGVFFFLLCYANSKKFQTWFGHEWRSTKRDKVILLSTATVFFGIFIWGTVGTKCGSLSGCNLIAGTPRLDAAEDSCGLRCTTRDGLRYSEPTPSPSLAIVELTKRQTFERLMLPLIQDKSSIADLIFPLARVPNDSRLQVPTENSPVFLFAAQGGGLYAAYHTAFYLATRADKEPGFTRNVFIVSGVSGGSIGAAVYWAIRKSGVCVSPGTDSECHRNAVRQILDRDFLAHALTGLFFRDNLDNFVPISTLSKQPIDRGRMLENALGRSINLWLDDVGQVDDGVKANENLLDTPLANSWDELLGAPLLLFNTTRVSDGKKIVLSPFDGLSLNETGRIFMEDDLELTVGNAAVMSARFPIVTPPGRVFAGNTRQDSILQVQQLADGGYFDNSGLDTLNEFIPSISQHLDDRPINLMVFRSQEPRLPGAIKGTISAPISAFHKAWKARTEQTVRRLTVVYGDAPGADPTVRVCFVEAEIEKVNFTVSWYLSQTTFKAIEDRVEQELGLDGLEPEGSEQQNAEGEGASIESNGNECELRRAVGTGNLVPRWNLPTKGFVGVELDGKPK